MLKKTLDTNIDSHGVLNTIFFYNFSNLSDLLWSSHNNFVAFLRFDEPFIHTYITHHCMLHEVSCNIFIMQFFCEFRTLREIPISLILLNLPRFYHFVTLCQRKIYANRFTNWISYKKKLPEKANSSHLN